MLRSAQHSVLVLLTLCLLMLGLSASGQELLSASDGEHVWLLQTGEPGPEGKPRLEVYHDDLSLRGPSDARPIGPVMRKIDPLTGVPLAHGFAAGDGRLVVVMDDRKVVTLTPVRSALTRDWEYRVGTLPSLPADCGLRAVAVTESGVWALVRVESPTLLSALDRQRLERRDDAGPDEILNEALGLPRQLEFTRPSDSQDGAGAGQDESDQAESGDSESSETERDEALDASGVEEDAGAQAAEDGSRLDEAAATDGDADADSEADESGGAVEASEPFMPVYRLIRADRARWVSVPLPEDFGYPREAALLGRTGDARPTIVARYDASSNAPLRVLRWSKPEAESGEDSESETEAEAETDAETDADAERADALSQDGPADHGWSEQYFRLPRLGNWAAAEVDGQVVVGIEQFRSASQVDVDLYVLRNARSWLIARLALPTDGMAQWALLGLGDRAGVLAVPGPRLMPYADGTPAPPALAGLRTVTLDGQTEEQIRPVSLHRPTPMQQNVNYLFQIITYFAAMIIMMMFWRRMPGDGQLRLPERVVIASIDKRLISALLDLTPGLILASLIYGVSWMEIIMLWPGSPTEKTFAAMRPGLLVIGVTVVHTTIFELITARSIGKWLTGLYVSNYKGIPAPPGASTVRAVTRLFDLIALLLLIIPLLSPYRQRLGDILARTVVVTRLPDPEEEERKRKERERQLREQEDEY